MNSNRKIPTTAFVASKAILFVLTAGNTDRYYVSPEILESDNAAAATGRCFNDPDDFMSWIKEGAQ